MMAGIIFDLSGNWIEHMQCDEIMMQDRMSPWQLIYFGSLESLADPDGEMRFLKSVSMIDRYEFFIEKPSFHVIDDPLCTAVVSHLHFVKFAFCHGFGVRDGTNIL